MQNQDSQNFGEKIWLKNSIELDLIHEPNKYWEFVISLNISLT